MTSNETTDPRRWYEKPLIVIPVTVISAILLAGLFFGDTTTDNGPVGLDTQEQPDDDNHVDVEPERDIEPDSGDWPSEEDYLEDMVDSLESVTTLLNLHAEATRDYANGHMTQTEYLHTNNTFREVLASHRNHFDGTIPPDGFESSHQSIQDAWDKFDDASYLIDDAVRQQNPDLIAEAQDMVMEGHRLLQKALDEFPDEARGVV